MIDLSKIQEAKKLLKQYFGFVVFCFGLVFLFVVVLNGLVVFGF